MNLAVAAAFLAALLSLVNVLITARLASQGRLQQWRREEMRPVVARILSLSREAQSAWNQQVVESDKLTVDSATVDKLRFELAQLDLIAHRPARDAARALLAHHLQFYYRLIHPHEPLIDRTAPLNDYLAFSTELHRLEEDSLAEPALTWVCPR